MQHYIRIWSKANKQLEKPELCSLAAVFNLLCELSPGDL